jgi:3-hydroxyisobutyrate dehydrogenase-like beta-hydroxyacid dehydrogenase
VRKYGVPPQVFQDVMTGGSVRGARRTRSTARKWSDESFDQVGSPITVGLKDANLIASARRISRACRCRATTSTSTRLLGAVAHGDGDRDQAVLAREQARSSGLE